MIAVTGATGQLGALVAARLRAAGVPVRAIVRDQRRAESLEVDEFAVASGYADTDAMTAAFAGCDTALLVSAREAPDRVFEHVSAVRSAARAGVRRIVYTSFQGAAPDCVFTFGRDHWHTEQAIRTSGMDFVLLRDSFYLGGLILLCGKDGVIRGPAADGTVAAVAHEDVAAVAATVLADPSWDGQTMDVTGPESMSLSDVARTLAEATGRPVSYLPETEAEAYRSREGYGAPRYEVAGWVTSYQAIAAGEVAPVSDAVHRVTGRRPLDFRTYLNEHRDRLSGLLR